MGHLAKRFVILQFANHPIHRVGLSGRDTYANRRRRAIDPSAKRRSKDMFNMAMLWSGSCRVR